MPLYNSSAFQGANWAANTIKAALLTADYVPDAITDAAWGDVSTYECSGTGYTAGGLTLSSKTVDDSTDGLMRTISAEDAVWDPVDVTDCGWLVVYDEDADTLICYIDCRDGTSGRDVVNGRVQIQISGQGYAQQVFFS